jgi:hypothetical protein
MVAFDSLGESGVVMELTDRKTSRAQAQRFGRKA